MKRILLTAMLTAGLTIGGMLIDSPRSARADHIWYAQPVPHDDGFSFRVGKIKFSLWGGGPRYVYYPAPHYYYVQRPVYVERPWWGYNEPVVIERGYNY